MYFGCGTPSNKIAWCIFASFTVLWVFLFAFVFVWGWENLYFVFIVAGIFFLLSLAPLCYLGLVAERPKVQRGPMPVAVSVPAPSNSNMQIVPKSIEV
eukprot:jgi/Tetstr1/427725/TSEL_017849.t1